MIVRIISDTHSMHKHMMLKRANILIHCGDLTKNGTKAEIRSVINWFSELKRSKTVDEIVAIGGNHDKLLVDDEIKEEMKKSCVYLENTGVTIKSIKIWGSPNTFYKTIPPIRPAGPAFRISQTEIKEVWKKIPKNLDILVTHIPPHGIMDNNLGCRSLRETIENICPKYHCFGHVHSRNGILNTTKTTYINAACGQVEIII